MAKYEILEEHTDLYPFVIYKDGEYLPKDHGGVFSTEKDARKALEKLKQRQITRVVHTEEF